MESGFTIPAMLKSAAIEHFGGAVKLGKLLGLTRQAIYMWPDVVPDLYQYKLHHLSGGQLEIDRAAPAPNPGQEAAA